MMTVRLEGLFAPGLSVWHLHAQLGLVMLGPCHKPAQDGHPTGSSHAATVLSPQKDMAARA